MVNRVLIEPKTLAVLTDLCGTRVSCSGDSWSVNLRSPKGIVRIALVSEVADSQNELDEAITVRASPIEDAEVESGGGGWVDDRRLTAILVAETLLTFTDRRTDAASRSAIMTDLRARTEDDRLIRAIETHLIGDAGGVWEEVVTHPRHLHSLSQERPINLVQAGVVLGFDDRHVCAFSHRNGFNFPLPPSSLEAIRSLAEVQEEFGRQYDFVSAAAS